MHDDVVAQFDAVDQRQRDLLAHAAQVHDGLVVGGEFHHAGGNGETHGSVSLLQHALRHPGLAGGNAGVARWQAFGAQHGEAGGGEVFE